MFSNRRDFLKNSSLAALSIPTIQLGRNSFNPDFSGSKNETPLNFISDGLFYSPESYLQKLQDIHAKKAIQQDFYHNGGATKLLEEKFAKITGKEKAIFLPTGTMANQLAIKLLNEENTKVLVPENSHIFRDEADAAQAVHFKRLIPVGKGKPYFTHTDLEETIAYYNAGEVFKSGLGTVAVEHPIRRADGVAIPFETLKSISTYCKAQGLRLHLDGARLHIASAYSGIAIADYADLFDTVYISLYKYLNAHSGAMLCGDASLIDKVGHQIKIYGGTTFQTWTSSAMALHYLEDIDTRWQQLLEKATQLINGLNKVSGLSLTAIPEGTNIYSLQIDNSINIKKLATALYGQHNIWLGRPNGDGQIKLMINESLLGREINVVLESWQAAIDQAKQ